MNEALNKLLRFCDDNKLTIKDLYFINDRRGSVYVVYNNGDNRILDWNGVDWE